MRECVRVPPHSESRQRVLLFPRTRPDLRQGLLFRHIIGDHVLVGIAVLAFLDAELEPAALSREIAVRQASRFVFVEQPAGRRRVAQLPSRLVTR
jgi:hypothetical protein